MRPSISHAQLFFQAQREEYWLTQPHYGGAKEIWTALKAACEAEDPDTAKLIMDAAGVIIKKWPSECYDERGGHRLRIRCCLLAAQLVAHCVRAQVW